ncbi:MAG: pyridoxal phosphate-dependent aminotransferase [Candidatus Puniceispirillaceae bacterium]
MDKVRTQALFETLLQSVAAEPESFLGFSQAESLTLGDFIDDLDPALSLDWNGVSFQGLPNLRQHVLSQAGLEAVCHADDVLITAGAAEANYLALRQCLRPGDEIIIERPGWPQAEVLARATGADIRIIDRDEDAAWQLPLDTLEAMVSPRTRMIFVTNPNNPTGRLMDGGELARLAQIAGRNNSWLVVDEVYAGLEWERDRMPSIAGIYERGIATGSVSKVFGMQGLRLGWMICRDSAMIHDAIVLREYSSQISNHLGEAIAEIALRPNRRARLLARIRAGSLANLDKLTDFIAAHPRLSWHRPEAGLIGLVRLDGGSGLNGDALAARALQPPYRTFLISGSAYGKPDHIRLGVGGGAAANLDEGLEKLAALLAEFAQRF